MPSASPALSRATRIEFFSSSRTGLPGATGRDGAMAVEAGLLVGGLGDTGVPLTLPMEPVVGSSTILISSGVRP